MTMSTNAFWEGSDRQQLLIRRCKQCGAHLHPRRLICPVCGSETLSWVPASGRGIVYSVSTVYRPPSPAMRDAVPYHVGIVVLEEGVHLFTRFLTGDGAAPDIDDPVAVRFVTQQDGRRLPAFELNAT